MIFCFIVTSIIIIFKFKGYINYGNMGYEKIFFNILGFFLMIGGIILSIYAVTVKKITEKISNYILHTDGGYSIVRNPIYSAFNLIFTAIFMWLNNYILFIFPFVFYIILTILMINTEEKWLLDKYGEE
ncbi:methyltransferase [Streptobacillus felis]|uniref:methyltransferase family protein n=1 Tax=Streptobacillus felis TaxID=1384509 RepID=UPI000A88712C|nr:methyltransferase [Streptobacillus felis]